MEEIGDILGYYRLRSKTSPLELTLVDRVPPESARWQGYPDFLSQLLLNLLTNEERHAYPDGQGGRAEVFVTASSGVDGTRFCLSVRDHGVGLNAEERTQCFEPFYTTGADKGALGLGLTIVRNIVTQVFGGSITCDAPDGGGTRFSASFGHCD